MLGIFPWQEYSALHCTPVQACSMSRSQLAGANLPRRKTLQVIALLWTLLRQGPRGRPAVRRVVVATPSSLTGNWAAEVRKWLGDQRLRSMVLMPGANAAQQAQQHSHTCQSAFVMLR